MTHYRSDLPCSFRSPGELNVLFHHQSQTPSLAMQSKCKNFGLFWIYHFFTTFLPLFYHFFELGITIQWLNINQMLAPVVNVHLLHILFGVSDHDPFWPLFGHFFGHFFWPLFGHFFATFLPHF